MSTKKIVLTSSDGESFEVEEVVARKSQTIGQMIEDDSVTNAIPLQNVTGKILAMVIEYCKTHVDDDHDPDSTEGFGDETKKANRKKLKDWDAEFMKNLDVETIFDLILAANHLNVKGLLDLTTQAVADYIKDKPVEEIRKILNIKNDLTPEEEEAIREENAWAFEEQY